MEKNSISVMRSMPEMDQKNHTLVAIRIRPSIQVKKKENWRRCERLTPHKSRRCAGRTSPFRDGSEPLPQICKGLRALQEKRLVARASRCGGRATSRPRINECLVVLTRAFEDAGH
jgi:hypothetical protein